MPARSSRPLLEASLTVALGVALAAALAAAAERWLDAESLALFFVPPVIVAAIRHGLWASLAAAMLGTAAVNFLFVEPRYTFVVARAQDVAALVIFALVATLSSAIAARARSAARSADRRAAQATAMEALATQLAAAQDKGAVGTAAAGALSQLSGGSGLAIDTADRHWGDGIDEQARLAARWAMSTGLPFHPAPDAPFVTSWRFWPIRVEGISAMALGIAGSSADDTDGAAEQIAALTGLALSRIAAVDRAEQARLDAGRERLKTDLLAGVSHDLRTPLSTILLTLQSLQRFAASHSPEARDELLDLAEREARRLSDMVDALLDASRIGAGGVPVRLKEMQLRDLIDQVRSALGTAEPALAIDLAAAAGLTPLMVDADLTARAIENVISNAMRHGGGAAELRARPAGAYACIEIRDRGPGLGPDPHRLFEPFVRGEGGDGRAPGLGLGLSLARKFLEAQGARIEAEDAADGGAVFTIRLPLALEGLVHAG